jgi:hypothetical protein
MEDSLENSEAFNKLWHTLICKEGAAPGALSAEGYPLVQDDGYPDLSLRAPREIPSAPLNKPYEISRFPRRREICRGSLSSWRF